MPTDVLGAERTGSFLRAGVRTPAASELSAKEISNVG
jgi:hypothetical protein